MLTIVRAKETTTYLGNNRFEQWAYTPPDCKPEGAGWKAPTASQNEAGELRWLWRRDMYPILAPARLAGER